MPHTAYDDEELGLTPGWDEHLDVNIRQEIKQGRIVRRENEQLRQERDRLEAETLIYRSGIPAGTKADVVARTFEGDRKDPAAVKAYYEELFGPVEGSSGTGAPASTAGDQAIHDAGSAGTSSGTPGTVDLSEAIKGAKDAAEVRAILKRASEQTGLYDGREPGTHIPRLPDDA